MKYISFFGGDSKTGTTSIAYCAADRLAAMNYKTLLIFASGKSSRYLTGKSFNNSIDDIKAELISSKITVDDILHITEKVGKVSVINDVRNTFTSKMYPIDTFEKLKILEERYDYVLIDGGSRFENAMTISALNVASKSFFLVNQSQLSLGRFMEVDEYILRQLDKKIDIVLNMYRKDIAFYNKKEIESLIKREINYVIPYGGSGCLYDDGFNEILAKKKCRKVVSEIAADITGELNSKPRDGLFAGGLSR